MQLEMAEKHDATAVLSLARSFVTKLQRAIC